MSTRIESTVADFPDVLAQSGASGDQLVVATVLDAEDTAKLLALRKLIEQGLDADTVSEEEAFAELRESLISKYPDQADAARKI